MARGLSRCVLLARSRRNRWNFIWFPHQPNQRREMLENMLVDKTNVKPNTNTNYQY